VVDKKLGADDGVRTRDLNLGKVPRYQLRYVRVEGQIYRKSGLSTKVRNATSKKSGI
jgi:hypothetical protein